MTQINKEEFEIKGLPHFISCLKRLVEVYDIELKKNIKTISNTTKAITM